MVKLRFLGRTQRSYNYMGSRITTQQVVELENDQAFDLLECYPNDWKLIGDPPQEWSQLIGGVPGMKILKVALPDGIGDCHWTLLKMESLKQYLQAEKIHAFTQCTPKHNAGEFLELIPFIDRVKVEKGFSLSSASRTGWSFEKDLLYLWSFRGITRNDNDLNKWLPNLEINYKYPVNIPDADKEYADKIVKQLGYDPIVFHASWRALSGRQTGKHWEQKDFDSLATIIHKHTGKKIILIGKEFEKKHTNELLNDFESSKYLNLIGKTTVPQALALIQRSQFVFGFQSGITFLSIHFGIPSALLWGIEKVTVSGAYKYKKKFMTSFTPPEALNNWYFPFVLGEDDSEKVWETVKGIF